MMPKYAKALLGAYAKKMRDVIHERAEVAADCAWCEREYGEDCK